MSDSRRKLILKKLVENFQSIEAGAPVDNPYPFAFSLVTRLPVGNLKVGQRAVLGIYPGENPKTPLMQNVMQNTMSITFEVYLNQNIGENLPDLLEDAMASLERKLMEEEDLGGLCLDINVTGMETDIDGPFDNAAAGRLNAEIMYRHNRSDPAVEV